MKNTFVLTILINLSGILTEIDQQNINNVEVKVNKCCEKDEIYIGKSCTKVNSTLRWKPLFTSEMEQTNLQVNYQLITGLPDCGKTQPWPIYHYQNSTDILRLLPNGVLRHYYDHKIPGEEMELLEMISKGKDIIYHDYEPGKYCLDNKIEETFRSEFSYVCAPNPKEDWYKSSNFLMRNVVNPTTHLINLICLIVISIIYFIMPTLRDLNGNILTTICLCLIVNQSCDLIRLLTVFKSHISLLITEAACYFSLLASFLWLNSLGFYIWKTFKSRNVFLRITDGKKYLYYSFYVWGLTVTLGTLAIFAHFTMDYQEINNNLPFEKQQEQIGSLGMIIFFVPVAFTILIDVFFFATTLKTINKMHTYGRIHHKLRHSFRMFLLLLITMTFSWLFFVASFSKYAGLINVHIISNMFLGPIFVFICIFNQKHVAYLLKKSNVCCCCCCCYCCKHDQEREQEFGDEMTAMNSNHDYWN